MKKYIIKYAVMACLSLGLTGTTASCTDYLDKAPESDVTPENAFKDFHNFQGFVEELYACIPDMAKQYWSNSWNWGEDEVIGVDCNYHMGYKVDQGDFWGWQAEPALDARRKNTRHARRPKLYQRIPHLREHGEQSLWHL